MTRERFKELGSGSFFRDFLYERAVPEDNFLRKLEEVVDWEVFTNVERRKLPLNEL
jgi:hypothetical protein